MVAVGNWISQRARSFDSSGIRRMFNLAAQLKNPINLSIGQPDFPVPDPVKRALIEAVENDHNDYALTQGIGPLLEKLQQRVDQQFGHDDRKVFVCCGTSGGLVLSTLALIDPGDEVIYFDPYFVMYPSLIQLAGGVPVRIDLYPDFRLDVDRVAAAVTDRTKMIIVNTPSNPTGICAGADELRDLGQLAARHGVSLVCDEIYSQYCYDGPHVSPAQFNPEAIVVDGFSKSHAMPGLRLAYVHGPEEVINAMIKLQQFTYVCAPHPVQWAGVVALDTDVRPWITPYKKKLEFVLAELSEHYQIVRPNGAFYVFPKLPSGSGQQFVERALEHNLLVIPGKIFSQRDTHFRISYAVSDTVLRQGVEILKKLARDS